MMKYLIGSFIIVGFIAACSGGGGGSGGGSSSSTLSGKIQADKATCNNKSCITGSSVSLMSLSDSDIAGNAYAELNSTVIPAMNNVVARIEKGIAEAGVNACDFIGDDDGDISNGMNPDLPLEGTTEAGATTYKVQTSSASIHSLFRNPTEDVAPAQQFTDFKKKITAKDSTGAFMELNLVCNDVDAWEGSSPDTRPLIAKVLMIDRATGNKINAFYMKGATRSRLMLVGKIGSKNYKVYFTTTPYTTGTEFHIAFADGTDYMNVSGRSFPSDMSSTEIIGSVNGNANTCFTSNGCPNVTFVRGTAADASELITGGVSWTDAVVDDSKIIAPVY